MNIKRLEKLAEYSQLVGDTAMIANPQAILAMIELMKEMGDALKNLERVKGRHHTEQAYNKCMDALQRYKEMEK